MGKNKIESIDELIVKVSQIENDLDEIITQMESVLTLREAIREIQDVLEKDGKLLLYSGRWLK